jgi:2-oxoglutarate ferredoxin oxidoreductase subunit alpha
LLRAFGRVLVAELNSGQLLQLIRSETLVDARGVNKVQGLPFTTDELREAVFHTIAEIR